MAIGPLLERRLTPLLQEALTDAPVVLLNGPRQAGKTPWPARSWPQASNTSASMTQPPCSRPGALLTSLQAPERPRRLGIARGQFAAPESIDGINPLIADLFEQS